jgi:WD40 repeat protein
MTNQINVTNVLEGLDLDDQFDQDLIELESNNNKEEEEKFTLESILNEKDDYENDLVLKSLQISLSTLDITESITQQPQQQQQQQKQERTQSYSNLTEKNGIVCKQASLKMISSQLVNAIERSAAGLPTVLAIAQLIAIGTSRGLILLFDSLQVLKLYITTEHRDAISAMSFNNKCDRLLAGNAAGLIFMFDTLNGKCLRQITDAHPNGNSILQLKFTDDSKLACFSDSGGSVFMLEFKRVMGVRGADSVCLFSGSRGEVCDIEPLKFEKFSETLVDKLVVSSTNSSVSSSSLIKKNLNNINNLFNKYSLLAMASFTKIFVITLRPKLTVLFTFPLNGNAKYLPILNWQFVIFQQNQSTETILNGPKRFITPILAAARESTIHFFQVNYYQNDTEITTDHNNTSDINNDSENSKKQHQNNNDQDSIHLHFKFIQLQKCEFKFKIYNFSWLNAKTLAILDATEKIHICDIRTSQILQTISNLSSLELVYNSTFFKSLATGGYVSQALSYAGDNACYQTVQSYLGQMFILGNYFLIILFTQNGVKLLIKSSKIKVSDFCSHY